MSDDERPAKRAREASQEQTATDRPANGKEAEPRIVASDEDSDDEVGPMPAALESLEPTSKPKKRKVLKHEKLYLDQLPTADRYHRSFMHRDTVSDVLVTKTDFILTASTDGHLKFWKKRDIAKGETGIEFVKHYRAHLAPILAVVADQEGLVAATIAADGGPNGALGSCKILDVTNFDIINIINLDFVPKTCCWVHQRGSGQSLLAISDADTPTIRIYDGRGDGKALVALSKVHKAAVHLMTYNPVYDIIVSADESGFIEYWQPREAFEPSKDIAGLWQFKSATDLYEFKKTKSIPLSLTISPTGQHFVTTSLTTDRQIRIFHFLSGKLHRKYDESLLAIQEMQQAGTAIYTVENMEFGRRLALERELERVEAGKKERAIFDDSGNFVCYPHLLGIKVVNIVTNKVARLLGKDETIRFLDLSLHQASSQKKGIITVAMAASENPLLATKTERDPILFATAYKRSRFYLFSRDEPEGEGKNVDRDVFNEKPTREEASIAAAQPTATSGKLAHSAVIHTTEGDIHLRLFPEQAPLAVENFVGLSKSGYYEGVIFHRVIKKFMLQTGDPLGDGTGGESIWGKPFEDEFSPELKHDRPYTLSMANAGPKTNGSQFFITVTPTPWLDNKHTIFGRAIAGLDVIHAIENTRVNAKTDMPWEEIKIVSVDTA
ncbi:uncharacterized protein L969DRAFT_69776 [Mixia osmundae IAM 14324]|uniref:peptidylprolyl isomerase n=1 Tax=Mixia osmundae (strain CBS 9802 / IAM 14324 / JCM 22182 / KY 12970) TaxID=764103 RepID=G7DZD4_MIXOS|nr:uncharacterized protein L969DRAFT_69776 [Mixia osmundae IAM 14324]KEI42591.1 hypothetical protein L969DRAFT_69776 [Mixia osmundae IAM 14324]GAA95944.1 hypothetical protein E5Q_02602 [Mixia osmundae IAM 14324]